MIQGMLVYTDGGLYEICKIAGLGYVPFIVMNTCNDAAR